MVTSPIETGKGLIALGKALKDNPGETLAAIGQALGQDFSALIECGAYDRGRVIGEYVSPAFVLKFATRLARFGRTPTPDELNRVARQTQVDVDCASSFVSGTPVWTPYGFASIENITKGQEVHSRHEYSFYDRPQAVRATFKRTADHHYKLLIEREQVSVTGEHPLWVQGKGWVEAQLVKRGDVLATANGDTIVIGNERIDGPIQVFNFSVQNTPNYFVGSSGLWAHNAPCRVNFPQPVNNIPGVSLTLNRISTSELFDGPSGGNRSDLNGNLGGTLNRRTGEFEGGEYPELRNNPDMPNWQAHHVIPWEVSSHRLLRDLNFDANSIHNGIPLPCNRNCTGGSSIHNGSHRFYNIAIESFLDRIQDMRASGRISDDAAMDAVVDGIEDLRRELADGDILLNGPNRTSLEAITDTLQGAIDGAIDRAI